MIFDEPVYRPPWEAASLLLPVTQSCTWNKCKFCYRSKDYPFRIAPVDAFERAIIAQRAYYPADAPVFLVGSNNFALSARRLNEYLDVLDRTLPQHGRVSMFSRVDAIAAKSDEELQELANRGPLHLYVGTENGNDEVLQLVDKGHTAAQAAEQLQRLDRAAIPYTVFYILGLGGKGRGEQAGRDTAALFNAVHPERIVTTGMTVTDGTGVREMEAAGEYEQASEREKLEELRAFLGALTVDSFYDGLHALNPVHYRFRTGDAEQMRQVRADLDRILRTYSDDELEAAVGRKAMEEQCRPQAAPH